jgi:hypothetical protein
MAAFKQSEGDDKGKTLYTQYLSENDVAQITGISKLY